MATGSSRTPRPAIALLSGGLDSATTLAIARADGYEVTALSFGYGQRHEGELEAARAVARQFGTVRHEIIDIDLGRIGGSALTGDLPVPTGRTATEISAAAAIPSTYVPARNTVFLAIALAWCEVLEASDMFIGVNALDYSGYPDCRPEYIRAFEAMANLATKASVEGRLRYRVQAPLISLTKAEIIRRGLALGVDYSLTRSCYRLDAQGRSCGECDACVLRLRGFAEVGIADPAPYTHRR
ncbi:MAG: 7-cyano-7-deazaguanine synthase QueC [Gemmatimonadales bacterium]